MNSKLQSSYTNCTAKQAGFTPTYWSAISTGNDRSEPVHSRVQEGVGYA